MTLNENYTEELMASLKMLDSLSFEKEEISVDSLDETQTKIYQCPWDNQGDIILFI